MDSKLWWYVARSSGILTFVLLAASILWGLALTTRLFGRRPRPAWLLDLHRFLGGIAVVFLAIHVGSIMLDSYVHFGLVEVAVPLSGTWHPDAVAFGIVGMYLLLAIEITSLLRTRIPATVWRFSHYASFPLLGFASVHVLTAGTDRHTVWLRSGMFVLIAAAASLTVVRALYRGSGDQVTHPAAAGRPQQRDSI